MNINSLTQSTRRYWLANKINLMLPALVLALLVSSVSSRADHDARTPDLPSPVCDDVSAPADQRVGFRLYALGVQIYRWNGTSWSFVAPEAALFADAGFKGQVGVHDAGPTWETNDGSKVTGAVLNRCTPFPGAIPWLLLKATPASDHGALAHVTYIQRVNTIGGTAPAEPGAFVGAEARVPYTAEYFFYRAATH